MPGDADGPGAEAAVAVIRDYYQAINERDYERAYHHWGQEGASSRQTLSDFRDGFADTDSVAAVVGAPGRVEGAAGSRYVDVPVEVTAVTRNGEVQRFRGKYVLRRAVVDGATVAQRTWHIYSAEIARVR